MDSHGVWFGQIYLALIFERHFHWVDIFFPFSSLKISISSYSVARVVADKKSAPFPFSSVCNVYFLAPAEFKIFLSITGFQQFSSDVPRRSFLYVYSQGLLLFLGSCTWWFSSDLGNSGSFCLSMLLPAPHFGTPGPFGVTHWCCSCRCLFMFKFLVSVLCFR